MHIAFRPAPGLAALCVAALLIAPGAGAQMEIDEVIVTAGPCTLDGVQEGFFFDPVVFGSGIASISLDTGSGGTLPITEVEDGEFVWDDPAGDFCRRFDSLAEIDALGALTFDFSGDFGELDTIVVPLADYENGAGQPGGPVMVAPAAGNTSLPPGNTFVWATAPAWTELISVDLVDTAIDDGIDEALFTNPAVTSWTPSGIVPGNTYIHEVSFFDAYFLGDARTSVMGRDYEFISGFQALERKYVPEPSFGAAVVSGAVAAVGLFGARRRRADVEARVTR